MRVILTGSIAYDFLMKFPGKFVDQLIPDKLHQISITFVADELTKHRGGTAANIAYTLALLGAPPLIMGTVGEDFDEYQAALKEIGVDTRGIHRVEGTYTASFYSTTDLDNNQLNTFYSGATIHASKLSLVTVLDTNPELVVISPNDLTAMSKLTEECRQYNLRFVYDPGHQLARLDGETLIRDISGCYCIVMNEYETELFFKKTGKTLSDLRSEVEFVVITKGEKGSCIYQSDSCFKIPSAPARNFIDPTGAGDSYRAGLIFGFLSGLSIETSGKLGALCATYTIETKGTQNHYFTVTDFLKRYKEHFGEDNQLNNFFTI